MTVPYQQSYGYRPSPPQQRVYQAPAARESSGMTALRVVTYVLTSLASLLFIAVVVYGYVQVQQLRSSLEDAFGGLQPPSVSGPQFPSRPGG